jgi:hypothetical protein
MGSLREADGDDLLDSSGLSGAEGNCCIINVRAATEVPSCERLTTKKAPAAAPIIVAIAAIRRVRVKLGGGASKPHS